MPTNFTENYHLSQWEATDPVLREDFKADNAKIDAELKLIADTLTKKGDCKIIAYGHLGQGGYGADHPCTFEFRDGKPIAILMCSRINGRRMTILEGMEKTYSTGPDTALVNVSFGYYDEKDENDCYKTIHTVSWYSDSVEHQMNVYREVYSLIALMKAR